MTVPYDTSCITALLRTMPPARLQAVQPADFQRWPAAVITPARIIRELIANEQARRIRHG